VEEILPILCLDPLISPHLYFYSIQEVLGAGKTGKEDPSQRACQVAEVLWNEVQKFCCAGQGMKPGTSNGARPELNKSIWGASQEDHPPTDVIIRVGLTA
jgi:hypothetical protein